MSLIALATWTVQQAQFAEQIRLAQGARRGQQVGHRVTELGPLAHPNCPSVCRLLRLESYAAAHADQGRCSEGPAWRN